jgi:hypothetical protein
MIRLSRPLPLSVLLGQERAALAQGVAQGLTQGGGVWFSASRERFEQGAPDGAPSAWHDTRGARTMVRARPNEGGSRAGPDALILQPGCHGGFVLEDALTDARIFTVAVIWRSAHNTAQTLLSVMAGDDDNILFLTESDGMLVAKDRGGAVEVAVPLPEPGNGPRLAVVTLMADRLMLQAFGTTVTAFGAVGKMDQPGSLFVGCRSHRRRLLRTLGDGEVMDVLFWPGRALLSRATPDDRARLAEIEQYGQGGLDGALM